MARDELAHGRAEEAWHGVKQSKRNLLVRPAQRRRGLRRPAARQLAALAATGSPS